MIYYIGSANNVLSQFKRHLCSQDVFVIVIQYQYGSTLGLKSHLGRKRVCPPAIKTLVIRARRVVVLGSVPERDANNFLNWPICKTISNFSNCMIQNVAVT